MVLSSLAQPVVLGLLAIAAVGPAATLQPEGEGACNPTWDIVPSPNVGAGDNALAHVAVVSPSDIWTVGNFTSGSTRKTLTEHWNGSSWSVVPSPNSANPINYLTGVSAIDTDDVWAAGFSSTASQNGQSFTLIERWNGSSWSKVPSPNAQLPGSAPDSNELFDVAAVSANDVWTVGRTYDFSVSQTLILHWNGSSWSVVPSPSPGLFGWLYAVAAVGANDVWAIGTHYVNGVQVSLIEHWNGSSWTVVPSPNVGTFHNSFLGISVTAANDIWAVGYHQQASPGQQYQTSILHWNGAAWSVVPSPNATPLNNYLFDVVGISATDAWAVGFYDTGNELLTMIQHWDGSQWSIVPSPNSSTSLNELTGVAAASSGDVWAVGQAFGFFTWETLVERLVCPPSGPTMHVASIAPRVRTQQVSARIVIEDASGAAVAGATVTVEVTLPDLTTLNRSGTTNAQGQTSVAVPKSQSGTYTFTVTSVAKPSFTYDPSANEETSDSVVVP